MTATALSSAIVAPALAQLEALEGPEWPQFQGGPEHRGTLEDGPQPPYRVRWTLAAPEGPALSGAAIFEGVAFTVGERAVYAVDLVTGEVAWEVPRSGGPLSVPAVVAGDAGDAGAPDSLLYLDGPGAAAAAPTSPSATVSPSPTGSPTSQADGDEEPGSELVAIRLGDRKERWRLPLEATSRTGVAVDADVAYVGDQDGTVYAVSVADGEELWRKDAGVSVDQPIAVSDGRVVAIERDLDGSGIAVKVFDAATGDLEWPAFSPQIGSSAVSAPAAADGTIVVGLADRLVHALEGEDGDERWASLALNIFSPVTAPAVPTGSVIVADLAGGVYRLDTEDGGRDWSHQLNEIVLRSSPVVSGETVLLGLNDGRLVALDAGSGHLVWQSEATPGLVGTIALSRDTVVAVKGGRDAGLVAYEHDPDGALLNEPSPTELELGTTLARFGIAAAIMLTAVLVPGALVRRRVGGAFPAAGDDTDEELDVDETDPEEDAP